MVFYLRCSLEFKTKTKQRLSTRVIVTLRSPRSCCCFSSLELNVSVIGSGSLPLPVTLSRDPSCEDLGMPEASRGRVPVSASAQLDIQYNQGVSAVIFSDHRLAHHPGSGVTGSRPR